MNVGLKIDWRLKYKITMKQKEKKRSINRLKEGFNWIDI